jgi:hypothetical protein
MSTPEPLDEHPAAAVEIRGGDRPSDYIFTPTGYQGPARHTYMPVCDGFHESLLCPGTRVDGTTGKTYFEVPE